MITSYAQNFEDVILWRALKSVEHGFYIDIGAQDPVVDSVSLAFYEQGWRGVHVEPIAHYAAKLRAARPDEEVIEAAIGVGTGLLTFHEFSGTGLSTGDPAIARQHADAGFEMKDVSVPLVSLQDLLDRVAEREVHWLKIDVEGMEAAVIESWGSSSVRPWIIVVESTMPLTKEASHEGWDPHLKGLGYDFVYFDGLNRFYVSVEHPELKNSFGPGPNIFDGFALNDMALGPICEKVNAKVDALRQQLSEEQASKAALESRLTDERSAKAALERRLTDEQSAKTAVEALLAEERRAEAVLEVRLAEEQNAKAAQEMRLAEVYGSISWRITKPLRVANRKVRSRWAQVRSKLTL